MQDFAGKVAVITGAASGFGREFARLAHARGMKLVLADLQEPALQAVVAELRGQGAEVRALRVDVARGDEVARLADLAFDSFGAVHLLFNNAGVGAGGFIWENSESDWQWVLGVNLWGVIHGVRHFVPRMLAAGDVGHIVNTASVAGLLSPPTMGVYNVSKHAVVAYTETLYQDLKLAGSLLGASVLCPAYVPTGIAASFRHRPAEFASDAPPTASQCMAQAAIQKAVDSGKLSAVDVARMTFDAIAAERFYVLTHPAILPTIELRCNDILQQRNPSDPYATKPQVRPKLDG
jgi:NAD(P)-dependent dehydrogenase (short-subunit alcohol dehydrogenase family)